MDTNWQSGNLDDSDGNQAMSIYISYCDSGGSLLVPAQQRLSV